jgi:endonuclease/exonuclease/phosphatase family metal-dependent hydrolase
VKLPPWTRLARAGLFLAAVVAGAAATNTFSVATYNLENYLDAPAGSRPAKPEAAKAQVWENLLVLKPDLLAVQEIGSTNALLDLRAGLKAGGLDYPFWEFVSGYDTNIHVAILSRFRLTARRSHTNEGFLLRGRRFRTSRGIAEVDVQVNSRYRVTVLAAHLKSRRESPDAFQEELREQEALVLRRFIDARLKDRPDVNLVVLGDFNDHPDSKCLKILLGRGPTALVDTRPSERERGRSANDAPPATERTVTWTHHYAKEDTYSRIDYVLVSPGLAKEWKADDTFVLRMPEWGVASDHRPVLASFFAEER